MNFPGELRTNEQRERYDRRGEADWLHKGFLNLRAHTVFLCQIARKKNIIFLRELFSCPPTLKTCGIVEMDCAPNTFKGELPAPSRNKVTTILP